MDVSRDNTSFALSRLEWKPAIIRLAVFDKIRAEADVAKESLAVGTVVDGDIDLGMVTNNITGAGQLYCLCKCQRARLTRWLHAPTWGR